MDWTRRQTLSSTAALGTAALAGCLDMFDNEEFTDGDLPPFVPLLAAREATDGEYLFVTMDAAAFPNGTDDDPDAEDDDPAPGEDGRDSDPGGTDESAAATDGDLPPDPLLANPVSFLFLAGFLFAIVGFSELNRVLDEHDQLDEDEGRLLLVNDTLIVSSEFDVSGAAAVVRDVEMPSPYEAVRADDQAVVFEATDGASALAITESEFIFSFADDVDPLDAVEAHVDALAGEALLEHERREPFRHLLRAGTTDGLSYGMVLEEPLDPEEFEDEDDLGEFEMAPFVGARGIVQHLGPTEAIEEFVGLPVAPEVPRNEDSAELEAAAVAMYPDADEVDPDEIEAAIETEADSTDVLSDGRFVRVEATYEEGL